MRTASDSSSPADLLTIGLGTTTVMWAIGYLSHLPGVNVPAGVLFGLFLFCLAVGGWSAGRHTPRGWKGGAWAGLITSMLNLLIVCSLIYSGSSENAHPAALLWIPGSLVFGVVLGVAAAWLGAQVRRRRTRAKSASVEARESPDALGGDDRTDELRWLGAFCKVTALTTLFLISTGGAVTSRKAGMAVPDWPTTEKFFMFFYPLARMTGGIYLEHAHRLWGSLVGLTVLVLTVLMGQTEPRRFVRYLAYGCLPLVIVQGVLGGTRVTENSLTLAFIHGIFAQVFFAILIALVVFTSTRWKRGARGSSAGSAAGGWALGATTLAAAIVQLALGAGQRHMAGEIGALLIVHITMAMVVAFLAVALGLTAWSRGDQPLLSKLGLSLLLTVGLQLLLGMGATIAVGFAGKADPPPLYRVLLTTPHQIVGAVLLALIVATTLFQYRLGGTRPPSVIGKSPASAGLDDG